MLRCCCAVEPEGPGAAQVIPVEKFVATIDEGRQGESSSAPSASDPSSSGGQPAQTDEEESAEFTVILHKAKPESPCGWRLDPTDKKALYICDLSNDPAAPVQSYNRQAEPGRDLREGDFIVSVNGITGSANAIQSVLKSSTKLEVNIFRARPFKVALTTAHKPTGLDLRYAPNGKTLVIEALRAGAALEANADLRPRDRILAVCGVSGGPESLLQSFRDNTEIELLIARPG